MGGADTEPEDSMKMILITIMTYQRHQGFFYNLSLKLNLSAIKTSSIHHMVQRISPSHFLKVLSHQQITATSECLMTKLLRAFMCLGTLSLPELDAIGKWQMKMQAKELGISPTGEAELLSYWTKVTEESTRTATFAF